MHSDVTKRLKLLSKQVLALTHIKELGNTDYKIAQFIETHIEGIKCSAAKFSKLKNAYRNSKYRSELTIDSYESIFNILDPHLKILGYVYNPTIYQYIKEGGTGISGGNSQKLNDLKGFWIGYSWYPQKSPKPEGTDRPEPYFNIFKVEILNSTTVRCKTKNVIFKNGSLRSIGTDRLSIELFTDDRAAYLTANISRTNNLGSKKYLSLSYTDTGNDKVNCGLAILKRVPEHDFDCIECGSKPMSYFTEPGDKIIITKLDKTKYFALDIDEIPH